MIRIIIDSSAWIEYLEGGPFAEKVRDVLLSEDCFVCAFTIGEVISKAKRKDMDVQIVINAIEGYSKTIPVTHELSLDAGLIHAEERKKKKQFGLGDAYILATARHIKAKILTTDHHFADFKETILLAK